MTHCSNASKLLLKSEELLTINTHFKNDPNKTQDAHHNNTNVNKDPLLLLSSKASKSSSSSSHSHSSSNVNFANS